MKRSRSKRLADAEVRSELALLWDELAASHYVYPNETMPELPRVLVRARRTLQALRARALLADPLAHAVREIIDARLDERETETR